MLGKSARSFWPANSRIRAHRSPETTAAKPHAPVQDASRRAPQTTMLEPATQQYWLTVAAAFLACEALYHASHFAINKTATSLNATDRATLALKVVNIVHAAVSGPVAFYFLFLQGDPAVDHAIQRAVALDSDFAPQLFSAHIAADQALALTCWTVGFMV